MKRKASGTALDQVTPILVAQAYDGLPAGMRVRVTPLVRFDGGGTITGIEVSGRTPSPFGRAMGDHTVAWQALVDAVHASLHGLTLDLAIRELARLQDEASRWMGQPDSGGMTLFTLLGDPGRTVRLEDSAGRTLLHLKEAGAATDQKEKARLLALAIAQHLAYLNYLPFATVPAESARGSRGSAEGVHRRTLTDFEAAGALDTTVALAPDDPQAAGLRDALWALFAFPAALRESMIEYAADHGIAARILVEGKAVLDECGHLMEVLNTWDTNPDFATARRVQDRVRQLRGTTADPSIRRAASLLADCAEVIADVLPHLNDPDELDDEKEDPSQYVRSAMKNLEQAMKDVEAAAGIVDVVVAADDRAVRVLSALVNEHQRVVAAAYPRCVISCGFLTGDPAAAAFAELQRQAVACFPALSSSKRLGQLLKGVQKQMGSLQKATPAGRNGWVVSRRRDPLVVTYAPAGGKRRFLVNGRAEAPTGVAGLGSHTTAWFVEVLALNGLIAGRTTPKAILSALSVAVKKDLRSAVMQLDELLPPDQLDGGHLIDLLDAAAAAIKAATPEEGGRQYLVFRNLLPFATVDAGSRTGHGENENCTQPEAFDDESLLETAQLQEEAMTARAAEVSAALVAAAKELQALVAALQWGDVPAVNKAARASVRRLLRRADALAIGGGHAGVADRIVGTRLDEHNAVWQLSLAAR